MHEALDPLEAGRRQRPDGAALRLLGAPARRAARAWRSRRYEKVHDALKEEAFNHKLEERYREWLEELREKTYIDRRGYFAEAAQLGASLPGDGDERRDDP